MYPDPGGSGSGSTTLTKRREILHQKEARNFSLKRTEIFSKWEEILYKKVTYL
jgi:hypothetical protein